MADEKPVFSLTAFATWFLFVYFYLFLQMCFTVTKLRARKVWNNLSKAMQQVMAWPGTNNQVWKVQLHLNILLKILYFWWLQDISLHQRPEFYL